MHLLHLADDWAFWEIRCWIAGPDRSRRTLFQHLCTGVGHGPTGQGVSIGHDTLCADILVSGDLVKPFDLMAEARGNYYVVLPQGERSSPEARLFLDWVIGEFEQG